MSAPPEPSTYPAHRRGPDAEEADWVVVYRLTRGVRLTANTAERRQAVEILTRRGHSAAEIARLTGLAERSVTRIRSKLRATTSAAA